MQSKSFSTRSVLLALSAGLLFAGCSTQLKGSVRRNIVAQMSSQRRVLKQCYRQALERNPATAGQVTLQFVVAGKTGEFQQVTVLQADIQDERLRQCLVSRVGNLRLQHTSDLPIEVTYPVRFKRDSDE